jgi:hypothetical protein
MFAIAAVAGSIGTAAPAAAPQPVGDMPVVNPNAGSAATCPPISRYEAMKRGGRLSPQHLDELPAADMYKAVYRRVGGCVTPIIVGYGLGAGFERSSGKR